MTKAVYFITGTDTDCGKTLITCAFMHKMQQEGLMVNAMKPIAAGTIQYEGEEWNEDVLMLIKHASSAELNHKLVNPYLFRSAIAPHIAAHQESVEIDLQRVQHQLKQIISLSDLVLVEGAGGWLVPLTSSLDVGGLAMSLHLPVILVVGLKLGCINHARLTMQVMQSQGAKVVGWVGTQIEKNMLAFDENVETLKEVLNIPCLGIVPFMDDLDVKQVSHYLKTIPIEPISFSLETNGV